MQKKISEYQLENEFIQQLVDLGYEYSHVHNEESMKSNFRLQLNWLNRESLDGEELTDEEFNTILYEMQNGTIFKKAKLLRGFISLNRKEKGIKEIKLFNTKEWCKNKFQVTNQIKIEGIKINRYDVTILINGLPLVHIELKKPTIYEFEPFGQLQRYKEQTMSGNLFFDFVQIFIISNGNNTYYTANNKKLDKNFVFKYADINNQALNKLVEFTPEFLEKCNLGKYIARYMVLATDSDTEKQTILAMRSYQVHAVEAILLKIKNNVKRGYIWHTTGSGKTLTSFKICELLAREKLIDKILFVVDRQDLDTQTVSEYQKFNSLNTQINQLQKTKDLIKHFNDNQTKIIVTTINKLADAIKKEKIDQNKNVILIFDECHRSQLGNMHKDIDKFFNKPFKFGFTGTPILAANANGKEGVYATTEDVFGEALHKYLINDAIEDKNVLGFNVDCKKVIDLGSKIEDKEVEDIDKKAALNSDQYIETVAKDILDIYDKVTMNKTFNAMLAVDSIEKAIKYFNYLKNNEKIKIACIFTITPNEIEENETTKRQELAKIIEHYNQTYKDSKYDLKTLKEYKQNIAKRVKRKEIDLLIVADMFLTGFDAKCLNTLFMDKEQKYHNLIQSLSRTNRVNGESKDYGNIICYRPILEQNINEAVALFSNPNAKTNVFKRPYEELKIEFLDLIKELTNTYPDIDVISNLKGDEEKIKFVQLMNKVNEKIAAIQTYREFDMKDILELDRNKLDQYNAKYQLLYEETRRRIRNRQKESILDEIEFKVMPVTKFKVNYDYIKKLLIDNFDDIPEFKIEERKIQLLQQAEQDIRLKSKLHLIQEFLNKYYNQETSVSNQFEEFIENKKEEAIYQVAQEIGCSIEQIKELKDKFDYALTIDSAEYGETEKKFFKSIGVGFTKTGKIRMKLQRFFEDFNSGEILDIKDSVEF